MASSGLPTALTAGGPSCCGRFSRRGLNKYCSQVPLQSLKPSKLWHQLTFFAKNYFLTHLGSICSVIFKLLIFLNTSLTFMQQDCLHVDLSNLVLKNQRISTNRDPEGHIVRKDRSVSVRMSNVFNHPCRQETWCMRYEWWQVSFPLILIFHCLICQFISHS